MRIPFKSAILTLTCLLAGPAHAGDGALNRIDDWAEARGWEGVGLLMVSNQSTCTGALIAPDMVLTAAHCLYDRRGSLVAPHLINFRAAWRDGQAIATRVGKHALVHPDYVRRDHPTGEEIYRDLALLQLDQPIPAQTAAPFGTGRMPGPGQAVSLVSYGAGRNDAASLERACTLLDARGGVAAFNCSAVPGSSGSPVFGEIGGQPVIVSVVSALDVTGIVYGMDLADHLDALLADFAAGTGVYPPKGGAGARRITIGQSTESGARFVRP